MSDTKPTFVAYADLTVTSWGSGLDDGQFGFSAEEDNGTLLGVEQGVSGILESGTSPTDTLEVYAYAKYDEAGANAYTGGIDALMTGADEELVDQTAFDKALLPLVVSLTPISVLGTRFGPIGLSPLFAFPLETWGLGLDNQSGVTMAAGSAAGYEGMYWTTT